MTLENQLFCFYRHWTFEIALAFPNQFVRLQGKKKEIVNILKTSLIINGQKSSKSAKKFKKGKKPSKNARFREFVFIATGLSK